jgi:AraC-like DNA-binding protein
MTGVHLLIAAVIIVFVIAFIVTMLVLNDSAKKIISANTKLVENQNTLLEQNKMQGSELEKRMSELEERKEMIRSLQQKQEELTAQLKHRTMDEVMQLREQTRQRREQIEQTADMTDGELMGWIDQQMDETRLFTDSNLTLKTMAKALGLTQKRLGALFKDHPKYNSLGDYLNEKRFLYACRLLREEPHWTIEAVGTEAGFGSRRTFQTEVKRRLGITPLQYRQAQALKSEE